jgi:hypothetical protein
MTYLETLKSDLPPEQAERFANLRHKPRRGPRVIWVAIAFGWIAAGLIAALIAG